MCGFVRDMMTTYRESILYIICGGFTTLVNWGAYAVFVWANLDPNIGNALSWIVSVLFAFVVNKWIVFESMDSKAQTVARELSYFVGARIFTYVIAAILFFLLHNVIGLAWGVTIFTQSVLGAEGMYTKVITSVVEIALNWILSKYFVFRKPEAESS